MGTVHGKKQATLYVDPVLHKLIQVIAIKRDVPMHEIVDEAFRKKVEEDLGVAEQQMFGYDKKEKNGHKNGAANTPSKKVRTRGKAKPK